VYLRLAWEQDELRHEWALELSFGLVRVCNVAYRSR
jgi:hypothetical protein